MHILGLIFIFIIAIFIIGVSVIGGILRAIFGFGRRSRPTPHTYATSGERRQQQSSQRREEEEEVCNTEENIHPRKHKKIFTKDEGEYVDLKKLINNYSFFAAKKAFINAAHSSASTPLTTIVLGCNA